MIALKEVERRLKEAVDTLRCIPQTGKDAERVLALDLSDWPVAVASLTAEFWQVQVAQRAVPTEAELASLQEVMRWVGALGELDQEIVLLRAAGIPWRRVSQRLLIVRPRLWQRWRSATVQMAREADASGAGPRGKAKPSTTTTTRSAQPKAGPDRRTSGGA